MRSYSNNLTFSIRALVGEVLFLEWKPN